jgi:hypothetical protein
MNFLNKETLIDAAALGAGVVAGRTLVKVAGGKVTEMLKLSGDTADLVSNALPVVGGIATLFIAKGNRIATGLANGMFASSAAFYVDYALQKALGEKYNKVINGDVMMGEVMMNGDGESNVLMGAAEDMPNYSSSSYDFTYADAGELDY